MWRVNSNGANADNFGVALKTEAMRKSNLGVYRTEEEDDNADEPTSVDGLASRWFNWKTDGGGVGYSVATSGTEIHYGEVELQILQYNYEFAKPKAEALQLVPTYSTTDKTPSDTNICFEPNPAAPNPPMAPSNVPRKCQDSGSGNKVCAELKLGPSSTIIRDTRSIVSPANGFLGALGGIVGLILMVLTSANALLAVAFGKKCETLCAPDGGAAAQPSGAMESTGNSKI